MKSLLNVSGVTGAVASGVKLAMFALPESPVYPAVVYEAISGVPIEPINASAGGQLMQTRVQVTAISRVTEDIATIHAAIRAALEYKSGVYAGVRVVSIVRELVGPFSGDPQMRLFEQPVDYMVMFYDT